jgi:hypothetical protein
MKFLKNISAVTVFLCMCSSASAVTIFSDDFNRADSNTVGNGWNEIEDDNNDVAIKNNSLMLRDNRSWFFFDLIDAVASHSASTTGYQDIFLDFDWKASDDTESSDKLYVSWTNTADPLNGLFSWDTIFSADLGGSSFESVSVGEIVGANNLADFKFAFWTDVSHWSEYAAIDNVVLRGTPTSVSNPSSIALLGLGLMGLGLASRKKAA